MRGCADGEGAAGGSRRNAEMKAVSVSSLRAARCGMSSGP